MSSRLMKIQGFLSNQVKNMNVKCDNNVMKWNYIFTQGDKCFKIKGKSFQYFLCELPKWELWHSKNANVYKFHLKVQNISKWHDHP